LDDEKYCGKICCCVHAGWCQSVLRRGFFEDCLMPEPLLPKHGGYRKLISFQVAQLTYDVTVRFCDQYISKRSRTHDQMVQAARSGVQNIAEGSVASATSKKTELKLTNVARASLEELRLDYEDYLRQRELEMFPPQHPALMRFKAKRCASLNDVRMWVKEEIERQAQGLATLPGQIKKDAAPARVSPNEKLQASAFVANAALSLLNVACHLLDRQVASLALTFEQEGGFTERLYRVRSANRNIKKR